MKLAAFAMITFANFALPIRAASTWLLESSTLTYHAYHPMHNSVGFTSASKGKGICKEDGCDFLIAVPVNTFQSGDSNRDLHMVQAVNGGAHSMITVRVHLPTEPTSQGFKSDLVINFGGIEYTYPSVSFQVAQAGTGLFNVKGTLPLFLSKHEIKRPSLLGVAIKDDVPVDIHTLWRKN